VRFVLFYAIVIVTADGTITDLGCSKLAGE